MSRAMRPFPVPVSPSRRTVDSAGAIRSARSRTSRMAGDEPMTSPLRPSWRLSARTSRRRRVRSSVRSSVASRRSRLKGFSR